MKKQDSLKKKVFRETAAQIGDFMRYWGFRRIHGQIWTTLYLSGKSLSGAELTSLLKVSKALVSPALRELEQYEVIRPVESVDMREKLFVANPDFFEVIKSVLREREAKMMEKIESSMEDLLGEAGDDIDRDRLAELRQRTLQAQLLLSLFLQSESFESFFRTMGGES